jgi:hypothetical protein
MIIDAVTFTGNFGYSFSSEMCADFGIEMERERERRACCGNHHHILFVASKD